MLSYNQLQTICEKKRLTITFVAESAGLTLSGLRKGIQKCSLSANVIVPLCKALGITPNDFFEIKTDTGDTGCNKYGKNQTINQIPNELTETIAILREQLKEKDAQINNLISKLK